MDISAKILREVEFRDRLRGYDTDEVDDFLERVAVGFDELTAELAAAQARAERAETQAPPPVAASTVDDDSIKRTLVLAQRTADLAVREAQEEAGRILEDARDAAAAAMSDARESAERARTQAEMDLQKTVERLRAERSRLESEIESLLGLVGAEKNRLTNTVRALLSKLDELNVSPEVHKAGSAAEGSSEAASANNSSASPLGGLLSESDEELEPEDEEELNLHFALPDPPRPQAENAVRSVDDNSFRERLADPLDPDEELWDRWARTGENQVVGGDDAGDRNK